MKKIWKTPQLIILYKCRPEEAVLQLCKGAPGSTGPNKNKCEVGTGPPSPCYRLGPT